jgi:DNA-directed RNA polymerase subunit RPC12/RpoP
MKRPDEPTDYICTKCGEIVWLTNGEEGREYVCDCLSLPLYLIEITIFPREWIDTEVR